MFPSLKDIVDLIRSGISTFSKWGTKRERDKAVIDILKVYFLLKDCVDDGERLITEAGSDPVARIKSMEGDEAIKALTVWDGILRKQGIRLYALQGHIFGQDHLTVINPELQAQISEVVGYKADRNLTLHGIGATLFLRNMFPIENTNEEKARLVSLMAGIDAEGLLDLEKIKSEVAALRSSLAEYRTVIESLLSKDELLSLSKKARKETTIRDLA